MIITSPLPLNASPEEQAAAGHGLNFTSNVFTLAAADVNPLPNMGGFREANLNPSCPTAFFLDLGFSANPTSWQVQFIGSPLLAKCSTWENAQVGNLSGSTYTAQHSNASQAVANHHIRLLVPAVASNISSVRISLGNTEQTHLQSANFHRVFCVLHPTPRLDNAELAPEKTTTDRVDGRVAVTLSQPDPIFKYRMMIEAWENPRDLLDLNETVSMSAFGVWPSSLTSAFTRENPVIYRRPDFTRNMAVTRSSGLVGVQGLDHPDGPTSIRLDVSET